jgi:hypothetical protein
MIDLLHPLIFCLLAAAYLPALVLPPVRLGVPSRRGEAAVTAAVVLVPAAVLLTLYAGYFALFVPPFFGMWLAAFVAGVAGRHPQRYGLGAAAAFVAILALFATTRDVAGGTQVTWYAVVVLACGGVGCLLVSVVWGLRARTRPGG